MPVGRLQSHLVWKIVGKAAKLLTITFAYGFHCYLHVSGGHKERLRLSWLTNSVLVYGPKCGGWGGGCGVLANEYSRAHGAQINFGDINPY
jgi:hypothetical protein